MESCGDYSWGILSANGTTGKVVKMRVPGVHFQSHGAEPPLSNRIASAPTP